MSDAIARKNKLLALDMAYDILTDDRNQERYGGKVLTDRETQERFTYYDMLSLIDVLYGELSAPNVPLTWEALPDHRLVWLEIRGIDAPVPAIFRQTMDNQAWYTMESCCVFTFAWEEMGKRWRAWATKPTDEERANAAWED